MSQTTRPTDEFVESNRDYWNEVTPIHHDSDFYDVDKFLAGEDHLYDHELKLLGDVSGKRLVHLQCHFGMDTLAWARRGAVVTGVDISDDSIKTAQSLAERAGLEARFLREDVLELPGPLAGETFDIVYTGRGAICWLPDLGKWASVVSELLAPGGRFYLMDSHPLLYSINEAGGAPPLVIDGGYFHESEPLSDDPESYNDYADSGFQPKSRSYEWRWSISDIVNSLIRNGLRIDQLDELDGLFFEGFAEMERQEDGMWRFKNLAQPIPLTLSLLATKVDR